jgi:magnesium-transporting ATPase (P-type)
MGCCSFALLQVECSSLTGESDLVPASVDRKHDIPAEARNLVFMSSLAMNGEGRGIVIRTGAVAGGLALCRCFFFTWAWCMYVDVTS